MTFPKSALIAPSALCLALALGGCRADVQATPSQLAKQRGTIAPTAESLKGRQPPHVVEWDNWIKHHVRLEKPFQPPVEMIENHDFQVFTFDKNPGRLFLRSRIIPEGLSLYGNTLVVNDSGREFGVNGMYVGTVDLSADPLFAETRYLKPAKRDPVELKAAPQPDPQAAIPASIGGPGQP